MQYLHQKKRLFRSFPAKNFKLAKALVDVEDLVEPLFPFQMKILDKFYVAFSKNFMIHRCTEFLKALVSTENFQDFESIEILCKSQQLITRQITNKIRCSHRFFSLSCEELSTKRRRSY